MSKGERVFAKEEKGIDDFDFDRLIQKMQGSQNLSLFSNLAQPNT